MPHLAIHHFQTQNFRNLDSETISFGPKINCIIGDNGNGKTNLLEALYSVGHRKSFRKNCTFPQILSFDGEKLEIYFRLLLNHPEERELVQFSCSWKENEFVSYRNGLLFKKRVPLNFVFMGPFDAHSFYHTPKFRRDWFDHHISLTDASYTSLLAHYQRSLRQRNELLLKRPYHFLPQIKAIDEKLSELIPIIVDKRLSFLRQLENFYPQLFKQIFAEEFDLSLTLTTLIKEKSRDFVFRLLQDNIGQDLTRGQTGYGIHKDNYELFLNGLPVLDYASVGQQKVIYLSLLFAYVEFFRYKFSFYPIILIDDMSSELDENRWQRLLAFLGEKDFQIFITTANENLRKKLETIKDAKQYRITAGKVTDLQ